MSYLITLKLPFSLFTTNIYFVLLLNYANFCFMTYELYLFFRYFSLFWFLSCPPSIIKFLTVISWSTLWGRSIFFLSTLSVLSWDIVWKGFWLWWLFSFCMDVGTLLTFIFWLWSIWFIFYWSSGWCVLYLLRMFEQVETALGLFLTFGIVFSWWLYFQGCTKSLQYLFIQLSSGSTSQGDRAEKLATSYFENLLSIF